MTRKMDFYYTAKGEKVLLRASDDTLAIAYRDPAPAKELGRLIRGDDRLARFITSPELERRRIVLYKRNPAATVPLERLITRLRRSPRIRYVIPLYFRGETPVVVSDEFIAAFRADTARDAIDRLNRAHGVRILEQFDFAPRTFLLQIADPAANPTLETTRRYFESGLVEYAEPNLIKVMAAKWVPNDPLYPRQWHLARVRAEAAWDITRGDPTVVIAILDEGIDIDHEEFASAGKITAGYDFLDGDADPRPGQGEPHGTAVAGVAAADGDNGRGVSGMAPGCRLMPIRLVGTAQTDAQEAQALRHAADNGAAVINNSWGPTDGSGAAPLPGIVRAAIDHATRNGRGGLGCVVLFAAGNGNESISAPASLDGYASYHRVIAVAACNDRDRRSGYSDFGPEIDLCAPSDGTSALPHFWVGMPADGSSLGIFTTDQTGVAGYNPPPPGTPADPAGVAIDYTGTFGGTSSAAPLAAGVAALTLSIAPNLTREQVQYVLEATAVKIDADNNHPLGRYGANGHSQWYGYGRVDALDAVRGARSSVAEGDHIQYLRVRLHRTEGNRFLSGVLQAVDARRRPQDTPERRFIRSGPDGFLRAELTPLTAEADVDR